MYTATSVDRVLVPARNGIASMPHTIFMKGRGPRRARVGPHGRRAVVGRPNGTPPVAYRLVKQTASKRATTWLTSTPSRRRRCSRIKSATGEISFSASASARKRIGRSLSVNFLVQRTYAGSTVSSIDHRSSPSCRGTWRLRRSPLRDGAKVVPALSRCPA